MAVIGEFRSDLSITCKTDGNEMFWRVFCFPKSRINKNGGKCVVESMLHTFLYLLVHCQTLRLQNSIIHPLNYFDVNEKADNLVDPKGGPMVK